MQIVLRDGPKQGDVFEIEAEEGVFPVIMTNDHVYAYAEYMVIPGMSVLGERFATFVRCVKR